VSLYSALLRPLLFRLDPESAHHLTLRALRLGLGLPPLRGLWRRWYRVVDPRLRQTVFGLDFANPVGLAAGLDKNGEVIDAMAACGFGAIEIGTVTGQAQPGNDKPRLFRVPNDRALINRLGFNNRGAAEVAGRLGQRYAARRPACVLGINLGKSKVVDLGEALADYEVSVRALAGLADYLVVNVSSPNTPGLRDLQSESLLRPLLTGVRRCLDETVPPSAGGASRPLLLKLSPDLSQDALDAAVDVALECGCTGIIATNTTITRAGLRSHPEDVERLGAGGLSGSPLRVRSTALVARIARRLAGRMPIIGVGGIDDADTAWEKICHGATLVQVYTGLIYHGPGLVATINRGLLQRLDALGLRSLGDAVGRDL